MDYRNVRSARQLLGWTVPVVYEQFVTWFKVSATVLQSAYLLIYSMVQSPSWEANWFEASQEIPRISWNPKVHYRTHKRQHNCPYLGLTQSSPQTHIPTTGDSS